MSEWNLKEKFEAQKTAKDAVVEEPPVIVEMDENGKKSPRFSAGVKVGIIVFAALAVLAIIVFIIAPWVKNNDNAMKTPTTDATDDIINPVGNVDDIDDFLIGDLDEAPFSYTDDERAELRAWGYTGGEIEQGISDRTPAEDLIEASRQAQEQARATLSNPESPEYRALLDQTWLGETPITIPEYSEYMVDAYGYKKLNADYVKIPAYGRNLFLKIDMGDGTFYFMQCDVRTYTSLPDSGNINVGYDIHTVDGIDFIYNMKQIEV